MFACAWCSCLCLFIFFSFGIVDDVIFLHILVYCGVFFFYLVTHTHRPIPTQPPTLQGFCADAHRFILKCWWAMGVGWTTFRDSPYESDFILVTQVRAIISCLLVFYLTQYGSCTLRPPRLVCCFPLHRPQIWSELTCSSLSSTATKTQTSKGLAWRLNKSACNSANVSFLQVNLHTFTRPLFWMKDQGHRLLSSPKKGVGVIDTFRITCSVVTPNGTMVAPFHLFWCTVTVSFVTVVW